MNGCFKILEGWNVVNYQLCIMFDSNCLFSIFGDFKLSEVPRNLMVHGIVVNPECIRIT